MHSLKSRRQRFACPAIVGRWFSGGTATAVVGIAAIVIAQARLLHVYARVL